MMKKLYSYDGPVMLFDKLIADHWKGQTVASSEKDAKNNLAYQFKMQTNRTANTKISLPGKLT